MYQKKGPKMDPRGTPTSIDCQFEQGPFRRTL